MMRPLLTATTCLIGMGLLLFGSLEAEWRSSLFSGLADPIYGLDHFFALLAVGLWAGRLRGPDTWKLPVAFLAGMASGFALAVDQVPLPLVDVLVRIVVLGSLLSFAAAVVIPIRIPTSEAITTLAMIGGCHGYLHGSEVGVGTADWWFGLGALLAAGGLVTAGVAAGLTMSRVP